MTISLLAIFITLISSIFWGSFDGIRKYLIQRLGTWTLLFYLSLFFSVFYLIFLVSQGEFVLKPSYWLFGLITVVLNFLANYLYIKAIEISDISSSVPYLAFTSLFTALTAYFILGETLESMQILGICILVTAAFFINYKSADKEKNSNSQKGTILMILVSLCWALSAPFDKLAVQHSNVISHSFLQSIIISFCNLTMVLVFAKEKILSDFIKAPRAISFGSLIAALALSLQFYAYTLMKVSVFESLKRGIAIATAFIISSIFFKEKISWIKIIASTFIVIGAALIIN